MTPSGSTPPGAHVVFMGLMASGKTTIGQRVAKSLGWEFDDSDLDIQSQTGRTGREIAADEGVQVLHEMEANSLLRSLQETDRRVITAAASTIENPDCRRALSERAIVVVLDISVDLMLERIADDDHRREITRSELETMRERRLPLFSELADLRLDAAAGVDELVRHSLGAIKDPSGH